MKLMHLRKAVRSYGLHVLLLLVVIVVVPGIRQPRVEPVTAHFTPGTVPVTTTSLPGIPILEAVAAPATLEERMQIGCSQPGVPPADPSIQTAEQLVAANRAMLNVAVEQDNYRILWCVYSDVEHNASYAKDLTNILARGKMDAFYGFEPGAQDYVDDVGPGGTVVQWTPNVRFEGKMIIKNTFITIFRLVDGRSMFEVK